MSQPSPNPSSSMMPHHPSPSPSSTHIPAPSPSGGPLSVPTPSPNPSSHNPNMPGPGSAPTMMSSLGGHPSPFFHADSSPAAVQSPWGIAGSPGMQRPSPVRVGHSPQSGHVNRTIHLSLIHKDVIFMAELLITCNFNTLQIDGWEIKYTKPCSSSKILGWSGSNYCYP